MILHAQCTVNQQGEDLFGQIGVRANGLSLSSDAIENYALASRVTHDRAHGGLGRADLSRLGQAGSDFSDDARVDDIEFCAQA
ncbi:MAG: hypothetical protein RL205_269 [Actinomycetota bacterium]